MFSIKKITRFGNAFLSQAHQTTRITLNTKSVFTRNFWQQIKAESAVVFKNNHGMICTHLTLPKGSTTAEMPTPLSAIQNTIWANAPEEKVAIESVNSLPIEQTEEEYCTSFPQILEANLNNVIELQCDSKDWFAGKLTAVQLDTEPQSKYKVSFEDIQKSEFSSAVSLIADSVSALVTKQISSRNGLVILSTDKGHIVLPIPKITAIRMPLHPATEQSTEDRDQVLRTLLQKKTMNTHIQVNYKLKEEKGKGQDELAKISYISKGIGWTPQYKLVLDSSSNTAHLSLAANLHNTAEDLFAEELICSAKQPSFDQVDHHSLYEKRNTPIDDEVHYSFKNVSISNKETVALSVFSSLIPYTNVYRAELPEQRSKTAEVPVFTAIKIQNNTKHPWTSGAVIMSHQNFFTAQSRLNHTLTGESTFLNIGESPDVRLSVKEEILPSQDEVIKNRKYKTTSIKKTSTVSNGKNEAINFVLSQKFFGVSKSHDASGKLKVNATYDPNQVSQISWEVSLQPNESRDFSHIYTTYELHA